MPKESLLKLYDGVSEHFNIGDYDTFVEKMQHPESRKKFYDQVSQHLNIGSFEIFEAKVSTRSPSLDPTTIFPDDLSGDVPQYSLRAAPEKPQPGVMRTEYTRPLPFFNEQPEKLLLQPGGKRMLEEYGYLIIEPEEKLSNKEIAEAQNTVFIKNEILKEKGKGLSERDAYRKVVREIGGTPPNIVDLGMEQSITGAVFRIAGLDQTVDVSNYPAHKLEELGAGIVSMLMPVDAYLFKYGGNLSQVKQIGKFAEKAALLLARNTKLSLPQARVLAKTAVERISGGAGGFAAFDAGRDITSQIEFTGTVDPLQAVEALMKGAITGASVSTLGLVGSMAGKPIEFLGEVFGLGTVAPVLEGEEITAEGYLDAAATIIGLKFLNQYKKYQQDAIIEPVAKAIEAETKASGRPMHEVANEYGQQLQTALTLTLEGKAPEKRTKHTVHIFGEEATTKQPIVSAKPERTQLTEDVKRMAENMDALEKAGTEQRILDEMQVEIDAKVERLNEIGVDPIVIKSTLEPKSTKTTREVRTDMEVEAQREQARLDAELESKDVFNRDVEPNPMLEVPLHPADVGRQEVRRIQKDIKTVDRLEGQKRDLGIELQREFSDLDVTLRSNEQALQNEKLTPIQREKLERSQQRLKELKRDTQTRAEGNGIELQVFLGLPTPKLLKQLFGSEKHRPKKYSDTEIDRLYHSAMERLEKDIPKDEIRVKTVVSEPVTKTQGTASKVASWFLGDMVERTASVGTPTSKEAAELGRRAIDIQKQTHGELSQTLDIVLRASGRGKAAYELAKFIAVEVNGQTILMSRLHAAIEGKIQVSGKEAELVEQHRDLIEHRGRIFEKHEIMQEGVDGEVRPFKVMGRNIAPRIMSGEFFRILNKGTGSPEFNTMVDAFAKATGYSHADVKKYFAELKENITGDTPTTATRTTQAEHSRKWKNIPHAIIIEGELIPLVEYRPYDYAKRLAETGESRIGVAAVFGQELANTSIVNQLKRQIDAEGGSTKEFHEMIRGLSGAPVETQYLDVGFQGAKAKRGFRGVYNIIKQSSLSASIFPNVFEPVGNIRRFAGTPTLLKSIAKLTMNPKAVNDALEKAGEITIDIANMSLDPNRPYSSAVRALNEVQRRAFLYKYMNEFQEKLSALVALERVEVFKKGKGTVRDEILLREMGFTPQDARLIRTGKATAELYGAVSRRAPAHLVGGAARIGEQSRLERNRIFRTVSAFETYAQTKIRSLARAMKTNAQVLDEAVKERNHEKFVAASRLVASEILGTAVSGMATQFFLAYAYGGEDNVEIKWNEVKQKPLEFFLESWAYTSFAGLYGSIVQSTAEGDLIDNPLDLLYPWVVITEATDAIRGKGKYTYDEGMDRLIKFSERFFPANKVGKNMLAATGFGNPEAHKDDNAIKAYYRWKISNKYGGHYSSIPDDEIKQFRSNMIKAYNAIRDGADPDVITQHALNAIDETGKDLQSIASSIRGKKLLTKSRIAPGKSDAVYNERLAELRKTIGVKAYDRLQRHDLLLDSWSSAFN